MGLGLRRGCGGLRKGSEGFYKASGRVFVGLSMGVSQKASESHREKRFDKGLLVGGGLGFGVGGGRHTVML